MNRLIRNVILLFIVMAFLLPSAIAVDYPSENINEKVEENKEEIILPYLGKAPKISINEPLSLQLAKADRNKYDVKYSFFPGTTPFLSRMEGRTRADRDVWLKDITRELDSGTPGSHGTLGKKTTFTATFQNNGSAGDVTIRFKAIQHPLEDGDLADDMPIEHKEEKKESSAGAGAEGTVTFDWTPSAGSLYLLNFTAFEPGDTDDTNNHLYWTGWVNAWGDPCDAAGTSDLTPLTGNFHVDDAHNDPEPDHHSSPKIWAHWNDVTHTYVAGNNTMSTPTFTVNDFNREYVIWYDNLFSGSLGATDEHKVLISWDNNNWRPTAVVDATANAQVSTDWFHFVVEDGAPGMYLNYRDVIGTIGFRLCVGEAGGAAVKGYMFDDMKVFGVQNFTPVEDFAQITKTAIKLEQKENDGQYVKATDIKGKRDNAIEFTGDPGDELVFKFVVTNEGSAPINKIEFEVINKPEDWTLENVEVPADLTYTGRSLFQKTETEEFDIKITIPDDAEASVDFHGDDEKMEFNPYYVEFSVKGYGVAPGVGEPDPSPADDMETQTVEALVNEMPSIEVVVVGDVDNQTDVQGAQLEYTINIENTGNCNLTDDIDAEISITVENKPPGLWTVNLGKSVIDLLEYEEDEDVIIKVTSPATEKAGFFEVEIQVTLGDFESPDPIILTAGVEQFFGLELDFKDRNDKAHEVDPTQANQVFIPITFEVTNKGNGYDIAKFVVTAENKDDKDWFDLGDEDFIELDPVGGLHDEEDFSIEFTVPEDAVNGEHKFFVMAYSPNDPLEETETEEKEIVFTIFRPDLLVSTDIKLDPAIPVKGQETEIEVRIFNNGTTSATSFSVYLYIDDALVDFRSVNILQKGQLTDLAPFLYVFEDNTEYEIKVKVDPAQEIGGLGNVTEIDELNNEASRTTEVIAPDLKFKTDITASTEGGMETLELNLEDLFEGVVEGEYTVTFTVENDGEADAKKVKVNLKVVYYDELGDEIKEWEDNSTPVDIESGKSASVDFEWTPLQYATQYTVILTVDPQDSVPEESETNNKLEQMLFVTAPKPKDPDDGPGFEVFAAIAVLLGVCVVLYRKRR